MAKTKACKHEGKIEDTDYDLQDLLEGIGEGDIIWVSGTCCACQQRVVRAYTPLTSLEEDFTKDL